MNNQFYGKRGVTYEELRKHNLPKSRMALLIAGFKSWWLEFAKGMPGNLLKPFILMAVIFLVNLLIVTIGKTTYLIDSSDRRSSLLMYLFAADGIYGGRYGIHGFGESYRGSNLRVILPLDFVLVTGISAAINRFKSTKKLIFTDIKRCKIVKKTAFTYATQQKNLYFYRGLFTAFLVGFLLKNPIAILTAAFFLMAEAGKAKDSDLFAFLFQWRVIGNMKKKNPETVMDADVILDIYYTALGMWIYVPVVAFLWFAFHYNTTARVIVTVLFAVLFMFLSQKKVTSAQRTTVSMLFFCFLAGTIWYVNGMDSYAKRLIDEMPGYYRPRRTGSQLKDFNIQRKENTDESFSRSAFAIASSLWSKVVNSVGNFFSKGTFDAIMAGFNMSQTDNSLDMGLAAYESAMSNAGPLGEEVANAARDINSAMQGKE